MLRRRCAVFLVLWCSALLTRPSMLHGQGAPVGPRAIPSSRAPVRIEIDQLTGRIEVHESNGRLTQSWDATRSGARPLLAQVPARRPVDVVVVNANPLLYRYDVQTAVVARKPLPTCNTLGSRLASASFITGFATVATAAQPVLAQSMAQLFQPPPAPPEGMTRGEALVSGAALNEALAAHRAGVEAYTHFLSTVRSLASTLEDSLALIAELGESQPMDSLLASLATSIDRAAPGLSQVARVPATLREHAASAQAHLAALSALAGAIERGNVEGDGGGAAAAEIVRLVAAAKSAQVNLPAAARTLQTQLLRIENARARTTQVFSTDGSDDIRRLTLEVQPGAEYPNVFRSRVGRLEIYIEPSVSALCQVSFGVAFMPHAPVYVVNNGVIQNRETDQRAGVAAMLHVASAMLPIIGGAVGFGFGSEGAPDLYAAGTVRLLDPLMLNIGAVWQRGQRLPAGFVEGQAPPDPSLMQNLPKRYAPSFFWGVSVAR